MDGNDKLHPAARKYWQGVEDLRNDPEIAALRDLEFGPAPTQGDGSDIERRDFLKLVGTTFAAASITSGCARRPVEKVIPYVNKPEEITPGAPAYYATACGACTAKCGLLVKARDGRPIKVEGNPDHPLSGGGVCARGQASVIDLYDGDRLRSPQIGGAKSDWKKLDAAVTSALAGYKSSGAKLALLTPTVTGPATQAAVADFLAAFPGSRHVALDGDVGTHIAAAHGQTHGVARVPLYDFRKADLVVSFDADFLGSWIAPVWYSRQYIHGRKVSDERKTLSTHIQVETNLSLAGSNCDERLRVLPSEQRGLILALAASVAKATGFKGAVPAGKTTYTKQVDAWTKQLLAAKGKSLVVCGVQDSAAQAAVNLINAQLGNYGKTLDVDRGMLAYSDGAAADKLLADLGSGAVDGVVVWGVNPAYASAQAAQWAKAIKGAKASIALCDRADETASLCKIQAPVSHYLESWGDAETTFGLATLQQPLVRPIHDSRGAIASLLTWAGKPADERAYIAGVWKSAVFPRLEKASGSFQAFWDQSLHDGVATLTTKTVKAGGPAAAPTPAAPPTVAGAAAAAGEAAKAKVAGGKPAEAAPAAAAAAAAALGKAGAAAPAAAAVAGAAAAPAAAAPVDAPAAATPVAAGVQLVDAQLAEFRPAAAAKALTAAPAAAAGAGAYELALYHSVSLGDGSQANNPFLQELPDPLTKCTWDNLLLISPKAADAAGISQGDVLKVSGGGHTVELPAMLQPGLHDKAVAVALGYGRTQAGKVGNGVGANAWPFAAKGLVKVNISATGKSADLGLEQTHPSYEHRTIVRETTLAEWKKNPKAGNPDIDVNLQGTDHHGKPDGMPKSVWTPHKYEGKYRWGLAIDLNACTGCGACVVACNIENNIPVVGRAEVHRKRDMHWMRIDRYYSERPDQTPKPGDYDWDPVNKGWLELAENPQVVFQPVMCQHCENAGCETVCPVLATVHTSEGLNAMAYNRCIGTRYCANNCAYKVRRFNWFQYPQGEMADNRDYKLAALALNPDVTIRSRGVMEKCSMCVQRIQLAKSEVIREGRDTVRDGDVQTACQQTCPTDAIVFGNINDPKSAVTQASSDPRAYRMLEEVNTRPSVWYQTKVRNTWDMMPEGGNAPAAKHGAAGHGHDHKAGDHGHDHKAGDHGHDHKADKHGADHGKKEG